METKITKAMEAVVRATVALGDSNELTATHKSLLRAYTLLAEARREVLKLAEARAA